MKEHIYRAAQLFKEQANSLSQEESLPLFDQQKDQYDQEYSSFLEHYKRGKCYLCGKPFKTISKSTPCLHWLLRQCKFKKKDFPKITEKFDYYNISAFLRWVANAESGVKNINNLKEESSERKLFESTIEWKNIGWTLDCSKNDFEGHAGSQTDFPHWHFQMRVDGNRFINFGDYHIPLSKDDQLKIVLENDPESGFIHTFGPGGQGMQEHMDYLAHDPDGYLSSVSTTSNPENGVVHMQSIVRGPEGGISGDKINEALEMARNTDKSLAYCFRDIFAGEEGVAITTIASPAESVPQIAKRTERKRR